MNGIYIHIPFCKSRCLYCDFYSTTLLELRGKYVDALLQEWQTTPCVDIADSVSTVYVGGGTPSQLEIDDLRRLMQPILQVAQVDAEITIEVNPGDMTEKYAKGLREIGFNRLSMGVQSFHDSLLTTIGRRHNSQQAQHAIRIAQEAGFNNKSIDLMYGLPGQTLAMLKDDIATALKSDIQHISTYCLSYEDGTPLTRLRDQGQVQEQDDETLNEMYDTLCEILEENGWEHYEVSNFTKDNHASQHNSSYWTSVPYIGLGAGAHSFDGKKRWWNKPDIEAYIQGAAQLMFPREEEILSAEQQREEAIMLGLRTSEGVKKKWVKGKEKEVEKWIASGHLRYTESGNIAATQQGWHLLNTIIVDVL